DDVVALDVAHLAQAGPQAISCERLGYKAEKSDAWQLRALLPARSERPGGRAAEQRDELAAFHSITSSAMASSLSGTVRPSALAVLRLTTSSSLVGSSTGMSAGLAPLRILLT